MDLCLPCPTETPTRASGVSSPAPWGIKGSAFPAQSPSPHSGVAQEVLGEQCHPWSMAMHPTGRFPLLSPAEVQRAELQRAAVLSAILARFIGSTSA